MTRSRRRSKEEVDDSPKSATGARGSFLMVEENEESCCTERDLGF